ncbi:MAG TPA: hypothetical protein VJ110_02280 [Candidatus Nanoarchaeia archaeon]|nr:hypothetical protein [Candidatus Nanoarchaeia archaeon]
MVRLAYDKYLQNVSRLKNQKPFISSKTIRDTNKDPGETLESLMGFYSKQALSFGDKPTIKGIAAALFFGAMVASAGSVVGVVKADSSDKADSKVKTTSFDSYKTEKSAELYKDRTADIEKIVSSQNNGVDKTQQPPSIDIVQLEIGDPVNYLPFTVKLSSTPDSSALYKLNILDPITFDSKALAEYGQGLNKISYPDGSSVDNLIKVVGNTLEVPFDATKVSTKDFFLSTEKVSGSTKFRDKLSNFYLEAKRNLLDGPSDVIESKTGNPPASTIAKKNYFEILNVRRTSDTDPIILELSRLPLMSIDPKETIEYTVQLGNLIGSVKITESGSSNSVLYGGTTYADVNKITISGNTIVIPVNRPDLLNVDVSSGLNFGDRMLGLASLTYVNGPDTYKVTDTIESGSTKALSKTGSVSDPNNFPQSELIISQEDLTSEPKDPLRPGMDVSNNHNDKNLVPAVYRHVVVDGSKTYIEWWYYMNDNPVCLVAVEEVCLATDHHTGDWELKVDELENGFYQRSALFYHIKVPGINPGILYTTQQGPVFMEAWGHGLLPVNFFDSEIKTSKDPINGEKLYAWKTLGTQKKLAQLPIQNLATLEQEVKNLNQEKDKQFNYAGYPGAASKALGQRSWNPWYQDVKDNPKIAFGGADVLAFGASSNAAQQPALLSVKASGPIETSLSIAEKSLGTVDSKVKSDFYGSYSKKSGREYITALLDSYDLGQVLASSTGNGKSIVEIEYLDVNNLNSPTPKKEVFEYDTSSGEKYYFKVVGGKPQIVKHIAPAFGGGASGASIAIGAATGILTALGVGTYLKGRNKKEN